MTVDPAAAKALMEEAGMVDFEHELISIDDAWRKDTTDAVAAQLRDAGFKVKRTDPARLDLLERLDEVSLQLDQLEPPSAGRADLGAGLQSGEAWNEFGWSNPEFDAILEKALATADVEKRRELMAEGEKMIQEEGVTIQPYWRNLYNHTKEGLVGGEIHIALVIFPERLAWS